MAHFFIDIYIGLIAGTILAIVLMIVYVVFGGVWGTGLAGVCKTILIYCSMVIAGIAVWNLSGGTSGYTDNLPDFPYFSMWGRGVSVGIIAEINPPIPTDTPRPHILK